MARKALPLITVEGYQPGGRAVRERPRPADPRARRFHGAALAAVSGALAWFNDAAYHLAPLLASAVVPLGVAPPKPPPPLVRCAADGTRPGQPAAGKLQQELDPGDVFESALRAP